MSDAPPRVDNLTLATYAIVERDIDRYWVPGRRPFVHTMFVHEFGDLSIVVMVGDEVAGFLYGTRSTTEPAGYVHLIGVRDDYRRKGLARLLYREFAVRARAAGAEHLKAIVRPSNQPSIDFHESLGMTSELVADYVAVGEDRLVFRGPIDGP